jgi:polyhydroxybutyrate depolymerase
MVQKNHAVFSRKFEKFQRSKRHFATLVSVNVFSFAHQKRIAACILCSLWILGTVDDAAAAAFPDMDRSWFRYREAAAELIERGTLEGNPDGTFRPKDAINRAEFLTIVFRGRSDTEPAGGDCFADVKEDAWYAPYICAAKRREIIQGYPDGTFRPEQAVNFAEAMKMLLLAYDQEIPARSGNKWYEVYTDEFDEKEILARHSYIPWEPLNRERAADLLLRFLQFDEDRVIPNLSKGCGKAARDVRTTIAVNGVERSFLLTEPDTASRRDPKPLIVAFHGRTNSNEQVRRYFGLDRAADNYFIAYPAALQKDTGTFHWSDPGDKLSTLRDIAFFDAIVEEVGDAHCIDLDRMYTVGHSLGAWMANSVACARGDVVQASATVGGSAMIAPCAGPSAAMIINNPDDALSPHKGVEAVRDHRLKTNACTGEYVSTEPDSLLCKKYRDCDGGNIVVWCPHELDRDERGSYYPHWWPDGTGEAIIEFFDDLK